MNFNFEDSYDHLDPNIEYLPESVVCSELYTSEYKFCGCSCVLECSIDSCSCLQRSGAKYIFQNRDFPESYTIEADISGKPIYECNDNCKCVGKLCGNKLVQCGPRTGLEIRKTKGKGLGLVTKNVIPSGSFICEYAGRIITPDMAKHLYPIYKSKYSMNYIICINEQFGDKIYKTLIDPTENGNIGRYINHSCEPNCDLVVVRVQNNFPKLCIFAKQNISIDEEISFNYGDCVMNNSDEKFNLSVKCLCGKMNCKKFLPYDETCFDS